MPTKTPGILPARAIPDGRRSAGSGSAPIGATPRAPAYHCAAIALGLCLLTCGCTSLPDYVHNGFKVGPNFARPPAPVAKDWIDASDKRVRKESDDLSKWWTVFHDPALDSLICFAYQQNLTLRQAGFRVLAARAQLAIDTGNLFPQLQFARGDYTRYMLSREVANSALKFGVPGIQRFYGQWDAGFNLNWELDFWGRFRRAVESDSDLLDASVENYDDVLVTLLGDVATNYAQARTLELRIVYAQNNIVLQRQTLEITEARWNAGTVSELDVAQARSTLEQTEATIPEFEIGLRQAYNQLCILLGIPPEDLKAKIGAGPIPTAPPEVAVGIPADLLRRRPDVRRAERQAAAQCAQIGIAESDFYPHIFLTGTIGYSAQELKDLFRSAALAGSGGPSFQWNFLEYGRILNNVRLQDAQFQALVAGYQNAVLSANSEVENGLVTFLRAQTRTKFQNASVVDAERAVVLALDRYRAGTTDFTRVTQLELTLEQQQDTLAQARGEIVQGLIQVYRALGGGWQIRTTGCTPAAPPTAQPPGERPPTESLPAPTPTQPPSALPTPAPPRQPQT
jgi:NodT family efflux transporter outer membrane factor (OMF) lipoprotein